MTAPEMHYDFKQKLNKIDSQKNRDLLVPEIDWKLNEAQEIFAKSIAQPRLQKELGLEYNQRTIDDIRTIVIDQKLADAAIPLLYDDRSYIVTLPVDYWFYAKSIVYCTKGNCLNVKMRRVNQVQHDDEHEESSFNISSFEWREVNVRFNREGFRVFTDGTFIPTKVLFEYLKRPRLIYNATDWEGGSYDTLDGVTLTGRQSCELPVGVHGEIVDIAVKITAGDLSLPDYMIKKDKLVSNEIAI